MMVLKKDVYDGKIKNIEDKIPDTTNLATTTIINAKINEVKNKIPSINNLASIIALTAVENKIRNFSILVKQKLTITKITGIENKITIDDDHDRYITIHKLNKLTVESFTARLGQET